MTTPNSIATFVIGTNHRGTPCMYLIITTIIVDNYDHVLHGHLRDTGQLQRETVRVGRMPMEHVEFGMTHGVDRSLDRRQREIVPRRVQHKSSVRVHGFVHDPHVSGHDQRLGGRIMTVRGHQLPQRFQTVSGAVHRVRDNVDAYLIACGYICISNLGL